MRECFRRAGDLAIFCQMMLNGGQYAHRRLLKRATVAQFTAAEPFPGTRARSVGTCRRRPSASGQYFSPRSYGHTGYAGTSIWVDPDKELFVVS